MKKNRSGVLDVSNNGNVTKFYELGNAAKIFYDLKKLILSCIKSKPREVFSIICKYGSSLTDLTSYQFLSFKFGKVKVLCNGIEMPMESVIRNHTYKDYDLILLLQAKDFPEKDCQGWIPDVWSLEFMKNKPIQSKFMEEKIRSCKQKTTS